MKLAASLLTLNNPAESFTQRQHYPSPSPVASSSQLAWREFDQNVIPSVTSSVRFPTVLIQTDCCWDERENTLQTNLMYRRTPRSQT
ncbi:hypothetical protein BDR06DRAFT_607599 [Suillus hirtellus]|nr:hypothetical protein BDR06DRAFT_607599 [Suillus hirtellus]